MKKAHIKFSGKTACIVFSNDKESEIYESKERVLFELPGMIAAEKITTEEAGEISKQVFESKELPTHKQLAEERRQQLKDLASGLINLMESIFGGNYNGIEVDPKELPMLVVCANCGNHGNFVWSFDSENDPKVSTTVTSKTEAIAILEEYATTNNLDPAIKEKLIKQINDSALPDSLPNE